MNFSGERTLESFISAKVPHRQMKIRINKTKGKFSCAMVRGEVLEDMLNRRSFTTLKVLGGRIIVL